MKKFFFKALFCLLLLGVIIFVWQVYKNFISCPTCLASEQRVEEDQTLGGQELDAVPQIGSLAPQFTLEDLEGNPVSLSDFADKNVLLVFWATTCGWCEKERPDLIRLTEEKKNKIKVLAVVWERKEAVTKYLAAKEINFPILLDINGETQINYLAFGTPNHFFINKKGIITAIRPGYLNYQELLMLAQSLEE